MPPPLVRALLVRFSLLLHDSARWPPRKLRSVACCSDPGCRYHCALNVPRTLHVRPPHAPTARSTVFNEKKHLWRTGAIDTAVGGTTEIFYGQHTDETNARAERNSFLRGLVGWAARLRYLKYLGRPAAAPLLL